MHEEKRIFLVDGSALVYRAHFAFISNPLKNSRGEDTSATFGYLNSLLMLREREQPDALAVVFDAPGDTFRHVLYPEYKATRQRMPDEIADQLPIIRHLTRSLGIPILHESGVEADDVIGTLARQAETLGMQVFIVSGDKDFAQLVTERVKLYDTTKHNKGSVIIGRDEVIQKYGVAPEQIIDYMALVGDTSDHVPGVHRIGEKTAQQLIRTHNDLDQIYASLEQFAKGVRQHLERGREMAYLSKQLVTIRTDLDLAYSFDELKPQEPDLREARRLLADLEITSLLDRIHQLVKKQGEETPLLEERRGQYHLLQDGEALQAVLEDCKQEGALIFQFLHEYDEKQRPRAYALALTPRPERAWVCVFPSPSPIHAAPSPLAPSASTTQSGSSESLASLPPESADIPSISQANTKPHKQEDAKTTTLPLFAGLEETSKGGTLSLFAGLGQGTLPLFGETTQEATPAPQDGEPTATDEKADASAALPLDMAGCAALLKSYLEDPMLPKIGHDLKEAQLLLAPYGIQLQGIGLDTLLASYLLNPSRPNHDLNTLALQWLGYRKLQEDDMRGKGKKRRDLSSLLGFEVMRYLGEEVDLIARLIPHLRPALEKQELLDLMQRLEIPLLGILAEMERRGVALDIPLLQSLHRELDARLQEMTKKILSFVDDPEFNVNSPQQVATLLYEKLALHEEGGIELKKTKKGTGLSTDSETLEMLAETHPLPRLILDVRELQKLLSTYIDALPAQSIPDAAGVPRIHTRFRQAHTATGRLSSFSPNLQNIPIRTEQGRAIRRAFIAGINGWKILSADYSQVELRLLAHVSEDPALLHAFHHAQDIHARTASLIFGVPLEAITPQQRGAAKAINFGIIYGMGPPRLAKEIGVSLGEAGGFIKAYFQSYPKVKAYLDQSVEDAKARGYAETLLGRRRLVHDLDSKDPRARAAAHNIAVNTPIQGSAADLIKLAMIAIDAEMKGFQARMLLQIHDELLFEVPPDEIDALSAMLKEKMSNAMTLRVPLLVEIGVGENWADAH